MSSFSHDVQRYLSKIAKVDGVSLNTFNLYIVGCPLYIHHRNMLSEKPEYILEMNGTTTGFFVSLKEALLNRDWDVVTLQQASKFSPDYDTYQPYLNKLSEYVRLYVPKAKIAIHQTWAYEQDSQRLKDIGYSNQADMFMNIKNRIKRLTKGLMQILLFHRVRFSRSSSNQE